MGEMSAEQAERLVVALEAIAKATQTSAMMQEEQLGVLADLNRRLAEIADTLEGSERKALSRPPRD